MADKTDREFQIAEIARLEAEVATYKHAFESTSADRDRLVAEINKISTNFHKIADPLDAGRFRFDFERFDHKQNKEEASALAADWENKFTQGQYAKILESAMTEVPLKIAPPPSDSESKTLAAYYIASILTKQMRFEEAYQYVSQFCYSAPPDGTDFLPYDLKQATRLANWRRTNASLRGQPGLLINSLPKSASAFLSHTLTELLEVPILRVSLGNGLGRLVVDQWAREVVDGGAVTHEHFPAHRANIAALERAGIETIWIQVRDPRDCAYSHWKMVQGWPNNSKQLLAQQIEDSGYQETEDIHFLSTSVALSKWLSDWLDAAADTKVKFEIEFISFDEVTGDLPGVLRRMLGTAYTEEVNESAHELLSQQESGRLQPSNFRTGAGQEWRQKFSPKLKNEVFDRLHDNTKEFLNLDP